MSQPHRIAFVSLGCAKNLVDSEIMLSELAQAGYELTNDPDDADTIVVNTCGFLQAARQEAHDAIAEAVSHKRSGRCRRVVVAGCLVQRDGQQLLEDVNGIDALVGVNNRGDIVKAIQAHGMPTSVPLGRPNAKDNPDLYMGDYYWHQDDDSGRLRLTPNHYAYLRISEGCDQKCTFCTIPSIRGPMHCKSVEQIVAEARELIADGAVELNLIGQDTTSYGRDLGEAADLAGLLRELDKLHDLRWIRLLYAYPFGFSDDMIRAIADCDKVVNYIDLPLQHISDSLLKAMHRRVTRADTVGLLQRLRSMIPGVAVRTTFIVGFPGETQRDFEELLDFVKESRFDALGVFTYSNELGTPAARMKQQVQQSVADERREELLLLQQDIAFEAAKQRIGQSFTVMVDGSAHGGLHPARHAGQAPEVDSVTLIEGQDFRPGEFVDVRCSGTREYDLIAHPSTVMLPVLNVSSGVSE